MTRVIITGSKGRMGQTLATCARSWPDLEVAGGVDEGEALEPILSRADVVIDFSSHSATAKIAELCAGRKKAMVIGTTGHTEKEKAAIQHLGSAIPMVWTSNFSTGVNALYWLTRKAVEILGPDFDIEILEMHHRMKQDAPSGTAATLAGIAAEVRREKLSERARHGRQGIVGARTSAEIGIHSMRGGDVVGDHTVVFAGQGERLELTHKASSRETFARGALRAAQWVLKQKPGIYSMEDVLGLK